MMILRSRKQASLRNPKLYMAAAVVQILLGLLLVFRPAAAGLLFMYMVGASLIWTGISTFLTWRKQGGMDAWKKALKNEKHFSELFLCGMTAFPKVHPCIWCRECAVLPPLAAAIRYISGWSAESLREVSAIPERAHKTSGSISRHRRQDLEQ